MTLPDIPRAALEFLIAVSGWLTSGAREVFALWCEGRAVDRWTWEIRCD